MTNARRLLLVAASGLALLTAMPALAQTQTPPSNPWAHATSDVPADTAVRFGILPNGMRYAILRNATLRVRRPCGCASTRAR